ncbi:MAG: cell division initiation protein [Clostridiales bacterium]|nr:cell division initiation protein [Clostridiales bacterium]
MLTPVELQAKELKPGRGYQKKEMDAYLSELYRDYESLYRENMELKDKINTLSDGLNYYKDLEKTLQKTLIVAEKTAEETTSVAKKKADLIIADAQSRSSQIVQEANLYLEKVQSNMKVLMQQYESYRIQCKKLANAHLELLDSKAFQVDFGTMTFVKPMNRMPIQSGSLDEKDIKSANMDMNHKKNDSLDQDIFEFFNGDDNG